MTGKCHKASYTNYFDLRLFYKPVRGFSVSLGFSCNEPPTTLTTEFSQAQTMTAVTILRLHQSKPEPDPSHLNVEM
jgi:hypothetical protein